MNANLKQRSIYGRDQSVKKIISACAALALVAMLAAVPCVSAAEDAPKLIAHYEFKNGSVGKDSAGSGDMKVVKPDAQSAADAKVVEGPKGMSALEFDASYALITDKKDVLDPLKEYTVTFLLSPNEAGNLLYTHKEQGDLNVHLLDEHEDYHRYGDDG